MDLSKTALKKIASTIVRVAIGWHFLYEGLSKLLMDSWTAKAYLANSTGFLSGFYQWMASSEGLLQVVDFMNVWGLIFIGLCLFLGLFTRIAAGGGVLLLLLYYFAYPPWGISLFGSPEGHFYIVNRNLIEILVLGVFLVMKLPSWSMDALLLRRKQSQAEKESAPKDSGGEEGADSSRRDALKHLATLPVLGVMGWGAFRHSKKQVDVMSGATVQLNFSSLDELEAPCPKGKIGDHEISRLVAGGNLVGGWAHSRDLRYVPSLFKAYNTEKKVYETLMLAEQAGINSINIGFPTSALMAKYKKSTGSKIKVICQVHPEREKGDYLVHIDEAIDMGADIIQLQGNQVDWMVRDGQLDKIQLMMDHIRKQGYTAGLASHTVDALIATEEAGIIPDYYMKTMHHDNYWSAHPRENRVPFEVDGPRSLDHNQFHDNCFCLFPDRTVEFVERATVPVMGFKILAAGAIAPEDGFNWAFSNGADFICVGMFDFQIVEDVNTTVKVLNNLQGRRREWYG